MLNKHHIAAMGCVAILLALSSTSAAAAAGDSAEANYRKERAYCLSGQSTQSQKTCLKEAAAARYEARHGGLTTPSPEMLARNLMHRCQSQPIQDREDCTRRMNGEGIEEGSVAEGAIVREMTTVKITPAAGPASAPSR